jgi:gas vesicle protein
MPRFSKSQAAGFFMTGALFGATIALLYAPKSGAQTRKNIRKFSVKTVNRLDDLQEDIRDQVTDWVEDVGCVVKDGINAGKKLSTHGYAQVMGVFDNAKKYVEDGKTRLEKMIQTA